MLPRQRDCTAHLLNPTTCAEESLHYDGVGNANASTVVEALSGTHECGDNTTFMWTTILLPSRAIVPRKDLLLS